jgi:phage shock protein E
MKKFSTLLILLFSLASLANSTVIGIDVRTWPERKLNPAEGSLAISRGDFKEELAKKKIEKDQSIVVFCESGRRATAAREELIELGYKNVKNIGSWREWNRDYRKKEKK